MKVLLFTGVIFVSYNCNVSLVVIPNEHVHSILIANKLHCKVHNIINYLTNYNYSCGNIPVCILA